MDLKFLDAGMGNYVYLDNVLAFMDSASASAKKVFLAAKENGKVLNLTKGRKAYSYILLKDGFVASSVLLPKTGISRMTKQCKKIAEL